MKNKLMSMSDAVQKYVHDRDIIAIGGFGLSRDCTLFCKEILRQRKKGNIYVNDLIITEAGVRQGSSLLVAEGIVDAMFSPFSGHERAGISIILRDAIEKGIPRKLRWEEETNLTLNLKLMAGALNIPFIPCNSGVWGDISKPGLSGGGYSYPKDIIMEDPYGSGQKVALLSALRPDVSVVHVPFADPHGNGIILGSQYYDIWLSRAGKKIVLTAEFIVDTAMCRQYPNLVAIPGVGVDAVVPARYGAWPENTVGVYREDTEHLRNFIKKSSRGDALKEYIEKYVYSWDNYEEYVSLINEDRLKQLEDDPSRVLIEPFTQWVYSPEKIASFIG